ncbi:MAG: hypothetical protein M2R45_04671 [Verrucomicrobia subdivision 3 bacterium]|nr:hypothetical protein [Limisphaerales bacterium]MCS1416593.1 hypothetical protein [Limisphaerales bacterium]
MGCIRNQSFLNMATYTYETIPQKKGERRRRFEVQQRMTDPPLKKDPKTGAPVKRVITGGSGWVTHGPSIMSMNTKKA